MDIPGAWQLLERALKYEGVSRSFRTGRLEPKLQMVQLSATRCSYIAVLLVSLVSFTAITLCVTSQRVITKVSICLVIDSVWKLLDTPSYSSWQFVTCKEFCFIRRLKITSNSRGQTYQWSIFSRRVYELSLILCMFLKITWTDRVLHFMIFISWVSMKDAHSLFHTFNIQPLKGVLPATSVYVREQVTIALLY
jgi:hypothetical protein